MKRLFSWTLVLGLAVIAAGPAFTQTFGIEAHGLYAFEFDGSLNGDDLNLDDSFGGGGAIVLSASDYLKFDLGIDYLKADLKDSDFAGLEGGDFEMLPVTVGVRAGETFDFGFLYVGGGIGYSFNDQEGGAAEDFVSLEDCMIYYACLGAEIGLTECLVLRPELRYNWLKPELKGDDIDPFDPGTDWKEDWKLDHFQARLGLGIYF